jgi:hypothetical protein
MVSMARVRGSFIVGTVAASRSIWNKVGIVSVKASCTHTLPRLLSNTSVSEISINCLHKCNRGGTISGSEGWLIFTRSNVAFMLVKKIAFSLSPEWLVKLKLVHTVKEAASCHPESHRLVHELSARA